jgi:hypothetical protein
MLDISEAHWAAADITRLVAAGIVDGYPQGDGTYIYAPERTITRAEFMKLIAACLKLPLIDNYDGSAFADWDGVADWAKPYVAALIEAGIVRGSLETGRIYINAESNISREEMVVMAFRALELQPGAAGAEAETAAGDSAAGDAADAEYIGDIGDISFWASEAVLFALVNDLVNTRDADGTPQPPRGDDGTDSAPDSLFARPSLPSRRDEAAVVLRRMRQLKSRDWEE